MKNSLFIPLCVLVTLCFAGCFKSISHDTIYVIRPAIQTVNQGPFTSLPGVRAYAFLADTTKWRVASYEDALAGVLTSKSNIYDKITQPDAVTEPYPPSDTIPASVNWIQMRLEAPSMMIVAVDPEHKLYAYRQQAIGENLSTQIVVLQFRSWRNSYADSGWQVVNEFYKEPEPDQPENPENPDTPTE